MSDNIQTASPLADLTYRNYDGPLESPNFRWWVISRMTFWMTIRRKGLWWLLVLSSGYYMIMMAILFFVEQAAAGQTPGTPGALGFTNFINRVIWKDQFVHGISMGQMWYLMIALLVGAGCIANDNRANALLVYLSKPCDKRDYLLGKWFGVFIVLLMCMAIPNVFFYAYGFMSYRDYGFLSDPWVPVKLAVYLMISAGFYSSLIVGVSSLFKQGRIAGATVAGIYFLTTFFTKIMQISWANLAFQQSRGRTGLTAALDITGKLYYASIDGLNIGLSKAILHTDGSPPFGIPNRIGEIPAPNLWGVLGIIFAISALCLAVAWSRIRAVEVVG